MDRRSTGRRQGEEGAKAENARKVTHVERVHRGWGQTRRTPAPEIGSPRVSCRENSDVKDLQDDDISYATAPAVENEKTNPTGVNCLESIECSRSGV